MTFTAGHHFTAAGGADPRALAEAATAPLSVIVQVTKRCDFGCVFCSETLMMPDPTLDQLDVIRANLAGVQRVFLSGGEPLLRRDLPEIVDMFSGFILGLPTNATRGLAMAPQLAGKVAFVNVGFDGPRATFSQVRGDYDKAMTGLRAFIAAGLPVSLSAVVLRSTLHAPAVPVPDRRRARLRQAEADPAAAQGQRPRPGRAGIHHRRRGPRRVRAADRAARTLHDWRPAVRMTPWTAETEGHMIVVEPSGDAQAWPVYDQPDLFLKLGNLLQEPVTRIWDRYPYKRNHFAKYLGASIYTAARSSP